MGRHVAWPALWRARLKRQSRVGALAPGNFAVLIGLVLGAAPGNKSVFLIERPDGAQAIWQGQPVRPAQSIVGGLIGGLIGVELAKILTRRSRSTSGANAAHPCARGLTLQPLQNATKLENYDLAKHRLTVSGLHRRVAEQSGSFTLDDVMPVLCNPDTLAMRGLQPLLPHRTRPAVGGHPDRAGTGPAGARDACPCRGKAISAAVACAQPAQKFTKPRATCHSEALVCDSQDLQTIAPTENR